MADQGPRNYQTLRNDQQQTAEGNGRGTQTNQTSLGQSAAQQTNPQEQFRWTGTGSRESEEKSANEMVKAHYDHKQQLQRESGQSKGAESTKAEQQNERPDAAPSRREQGEMLNRALEKAKSIEERQGRDEPSQAMER